VPGLLFGLLAFLGGLISYGAWIANQTRIDRAEPSAKRSMARKFAIWGAFGLIGLTFGIYMRVQDGVGGTAGFFWAGVYTGEIVQVLIWPEDNFVRNMPLYRKWALHYGERSARLRFLLLMVGILVAFGLLSVVLRLGRN
jgi:hypothetical protein